MRRPIERLAWLVATEPGDQTIGELAKRYGETTERVRDAIDANKMRLGQPTGAPVDWRQRGCGTEVDAVRLIWPVRINLGSIRAERQLTFTRPCGCDRNQPPHPMDIIGPERLTEESAQLVEQARAKIRARRKGAA